MENVRRIELVDVRQAASLGAREKQVKLKWIAAVLTVVMAGVAGAQNINAAGATFPYPIYNRWFTEYAQAHPNVHINYQSIGSGGGVQQTSEGTVDFGASDMPVADEKIAAAKVKFWNLPTVLGAVVPVYNIPGVSQTLNFSGDVLADISLDVERPANRERQPGGEPAGQGDPAGVPLGRERHDLYLYGLLVEG